jgi:putative tryptophan/tyrosine transport system substrate-binding protein
VFIEHRAVEGRADSRPALIADLVQRRMAVIVTDATLLAREIKAATQTIPIVFLAGGDPIEFGLVQSLKRPGGNVTGVALMGIEIAAKRLELLRKLVPAAGTIAMMVGIGSLAGEQKNTKIRLPLGIATKSDFVFAQLRPGAEVPIKFESG